MIGQNSPATPVPSTARPSGVGSMRASERIGTSVPSAVVARATPSSHHSASTPACWRPRPTREADRERHPPADRAAAESVARHVVLDDLEPGEEEEKREAEVGEEVDVLVDLGEPEHLGADEDPEHDLDDDGRQDEPQVPSRQYGAERRGEETKTSDCASSRVSSAARSSTLTRARPDGPPMPWRSDPPARSTSTVAPHFAATASSSRASSRSTASRRSGSTLSDSSSSIARRRLTTCTDASPYSRISVTLSVR